MTILPDGGDPSATIEWHRGTCPRCGSGAVLHHFIGMPVLEYYESSPPWVSWDGCCGFGPDRECLTCDHQWNSWTVGVAEEDEPGFDPDAEEETPPPVPPLRTVGAVITDGDRLLVLRRAPGPDGWEVPCGEIAVGESPQEALARVLREDFGMDAEVGWLIGREERSDGERQVDLDCYWARLEATLPPAPEGVEWSWLERAELVTEALEIATSPVLRKLYLGAEPIFSR